MPLQKKCFLLRTASCANFSFVKPQFNEGKREMRGILEALYRGDIRPEETIVPTNPEYRALNRRISEAIKTWEKKLSATEFSELEELLDLRSKSGSMYAEASFIHGFQLGALMMVEVYTTRNELVGSSI